MTVFAGADNKRKNAKPKPKPKPEQNPAADKE